MLVLESCSSHVVGDNNGNNSNDSIYCGISVHDRHLERQKRKMQSCVSSEHFEVLLSSYDHEVHTASDWCLDCLGHQKNPPLFSLPAFATEQTALLTLKSPPFFLRAPFSCVSLASWQVAWWPGDLGWPPAGVQLATVSLGGSFSSSRWSLIPQQDGWLVLMLVSGLQAPERAQAPGGLFESLLCPVCWGPIGDSMPRG